MTAGYNVKMTEENGERLLNRYLFIVLSLLLPALFSTAAGASGGTLHIFKTELALDRVRDPGLKRILDNHRNVTLWGSWYPDSGYASGNQYGEYSHWPPFLDGYLEYIRDDVGPDHEDYEVLVAHLLGAAAHSIQDQSFDQVFLARSMEEDGAGQELLDRGLDMVCMYDHKRYNVKFCDAVARQPDLYTPIKHLVRVYRKLEPDFYRLGKQISKGQRHLSLAIMGERVFFSLEHYDIRKKSPWAAAHYYDAPGGVVHNSKITAAYWAALWSRLRGDQPGFVFATFPPDGGALPSTDHTSAASSIAVYTSRAYDKASLNGDTFVLAGPGGRQVPGDFDWGYGSNVFRFKPAEDLEPGAGYSVTIKPGAADIHGNVIDAPYSFSFTTGAAGVE